MSLHRYLGAHPDVHMSDPKEPDFFIAEKNYDKGVDWYERLFETPASARGEFSTSYTKCHLFGGVPRRMQALLPEAKLIYILRDPLDRIVSHYVHNRAQGRERGTLQEALSAPDESHYVKCSKYHMQMRPFLDYYPEERIKIVTTENMKNRRLETLQGLFRFIGVDDEFTSPVFTKQHHRSSQKSRPTTLDRLVSSLNLKEVGRRFTPAVLRSAYRRVATHPVERPALEGALRTRVVAALQENVAQLRERTGREFHEWSI